MRSNIVKDWQKHWDRPSGEPLLTKLKTKVHPGPPLKQRLSNSIYRLQVVLHRLESATQRIEQRDKEFFSKCTDAQMNHDEARAAIYANECAEIRKMARVVLRSQMAIEQVVVRLETIRDFGDVVVNMAPVVSLVHSLKNQLMGVLPEVSSELGTIGDTLNNMIVEVGEATGADYDVVASSEEAGKVLKEATALAEHKMSNNFPDLPTSVQQQGEAQKGPTLP
ncbi:MAG: Snf7 family protein [Candidatus Bathyarchaeia archaeon]